MTTKVTPGFYKHFKGGVYEVIGVGRHSESLEEMVSINMIAKSTEKIPSGHAHYQCGLSMLIEMVTVAPDLCLCH